MSWENWSRYRWKLVAAVGWLGANLVVWADTTVTYTDGTTSTSSLILSDATTLLLDSGTATQSGVISGNYGITKTGSGTIVLTGANTYTGSTTIRLGGVTITGAGASISQASSNLYVGYASGDGATLEISDGAQVTAGKLYIGYSTNSTGSATISGSGTLVSVTGITVGNGGTGSLTISSGATVSSSGVILLGNNNGTGTVTLSGTSTLAATQIVAVSGGTSSLTINGGTLVALSNSSSFLSGFTTVTNSVTIGSGGLTFDTNGYNVTVSSALSGTGALVKTNSGTLVLTGSNTYSGGTTIDGGSLVVTGSGATISHYSSDLIIGNTTTASMSILNSAVVTASSVIVGNSATGYGTLTVSSATLAMQNLTTGAGGGSLYFSSATLSSISDGSISGFSTITMTGSLTINTNYNILSIDSPLTGTASLIVTGNDSGVLILNAVNTYIGTTTISGGTLRAGVAGALLSNSAYIVSGGTLDLNGYDLTVSQLSGTSTNSNIALGTATLTVNQDTDAYYSGSISGAGNVVKTGTGSWLLYNNSATYSGSTTVATGSLVLYDYSISDSAISVINTTTLSGNGTISGTVTVGSGATLMPGLWSTAYSLAETGTLTVGNLDLQSGSTTIFHVYDTATYDSIIATGTVTLGGTLTLSLTSDSTYSAKVGDSFTFITASDITGSFSSITGSLGNALTYSASIVASTSDSYVITVGQGSFTPFAKNATQMAVAKALDKEVSAGKMGSLIDKLNELPGTSLPSAYQQIAPEELGAMSRVAFQYGHVQVRNVENRIDAVRSGLTGFSMAGLSLYDKNGQVDLRNNALLASNTSVGVNNGRLTVPAKDNPWGLYLTGTGQFGSIDGTDNGSKYDLSTAGINVGADYRLSEVAVAGGTLGFQNGNLDIDDGGKIKTNGIKIGTYLAYFEEGWYGIGMIGGGYSSYDTDRYVIGEKQSGSTNGTEFTGSLGGGYDFKRGNWTFGPTVNLEYNYVNIDSFTETGGLAPLYIDKQDNSSLTSRFGGRVAYLWKFPTFWLRPEFHLAWQHEYMDTDQTINARFANGSGSMFGVQSTKIGADSAIIGFSLDISISETFGSYVAFEEEANSNYNTQTIMGGLRYNF